MKKYRRFWNLFPMLMLWLVVSVIGWGFVFTRITDAPAENKMVLYVDGDVTGEKELAAYLEEVQGEGIRMVMVRPFTYAMFGGDELRAADMYIVPECNVPQYGEFYAPWPEGFMEDGEFLTVEGVKCGLKVYDHERGAGAADGYIQYENRDWPRQDYYLFFGNMSLHLNGNENAVNNLSLDYARQLLRAN